MGAKQLFRILCEKGPHKVLTGDLSVIGIKGKIFAPVEGQGLPAVVFTHSWLMSVSRYESFLYHLASWGFVVAAPANYTGITVQELLLAQDAIAAAEAITSIRLGIGDISVNKYKLGFIGHGSGVSAAVLAASSNVFADKVGAFVGAWPSPTSELEYETAQVIHIPALVLTSPGLFDTFTSNAAPLARALGGEVSLQVVKKSSYYDFASPSILTRLVTGKRRNRKARLHTYAAITGYLLANLAGDSDYKAFSGAEDIGLLQRLEIADLPPKNQYPLQSLLKHKV